MVWRVGRKRLSPQSAMVARKAVFYVGVAVVLVAALRQLGVQLTALLGAAGILGIAIGFASQTSVSNVISGLFLISEKPFAVGDVVKAGEHSGIVMSIDLLSTKIRTFDNQYIRIPNEKILTTELTNITYFPIRRLDIKLSISYRNELTRAREVLLEVADRNPLCLRDPAPVVVFTDFG
jgi:small-conductance mechanosensitive channel